MTVQLRLRQALPYVPVALVLPLLWVASEGEVAVKPVAWVPVAAVSVVGLWTAFAGCVPPWLDGVLAGLLGLAATHRLLWPGFPQGIDTDAHIWGIYGFFQAVLAGNVLPRWIHHVGLGMPLLLFYPPLSFYLTLPLLMFKLPIYDAFKFGFVLFSVLSGLSMFYVARQWTGDRRAALVAAGAYCFAPYHMLDTMYRAAMAEAAAMAVLPLFFFSAQRAIEAPSRERLGVAAVWTAVLIVTHPLSLSMVCTGMGIWVLARHRWRVSRALLASLALVAAFGLWGVGLASYYALPVALEASYTTVGESLGSGERPKYYWRGLAPGQILVRREWMKLQGSGRRGADERDRMPLYFGLSLLGLLPLARHPGAPKGLLAMTLGTLMLTLHPLDVALARFPPMTVLQYPSRFLALASFGACALAGFATLRLLEAAQGHWIQRVIPGALFGLLVLDFFPYGGAPMWNQPYEGIHLLYERGIALDLLPLRVSGVSFPPADPRIDLSVVRQLYPEYFTPAARRAYLRTPGEYQIEMLERAAVGLTLREGKPVTLNPRPYAEFTPADGGPARGLAFTRVGEWIRVKLAGEAGSLVVKEQWFPGWEGRLGREAVEVGKTTDGLMAFKLAAADTGELTLHFSRTRWERLAGMVLSVACLIGLWWPRSRQKVGG